MSRHDDREAPGDHARPGKRVLYGTPRQVLSRLLWLSEHTKILEISAHSPVPGEERKAGWVHEGEPIELSDGQLLEGTNAKPPRKQAKPKKTVPGHYTRDEWRTKKSRDRGRAKRERDREEKYQKLMTIDPEKAKRWRKISDNAKRRAARKAKKTKDAAKEKNKQ